LRISVQKTVDQHFVDGWHEFYLTLGGASAALVGLLFVGLSLHLPQVIRRPEIRGLGRQAFAGFLAILFISLFVLIPLQNPISLGIELLFLGVLSFVEMLPRLRTSLERRRQTTHFADHMRRFVLAVAAFLGLIGVAIALLFRQADALYWLVGVVLILLITSVRNAWDLLLQVGEDAEMGVSDRG
jgi:hypothetical protein